MQESTVMQESTEDSVYIDVDRVGLAQAREKVAQQTVS